VRPLCIIVVLDIWLKKDRSLNMRSYLKGTKANRADVLNIMNPGPSQLSYPMTAQMPTYCVDTDRPGSGDTPPSTGRTEAAEVSLVWGVAVEPPYRVLRNAGTSIVFEDQS
jgi:hypothetical protein